MKAGSDDRWWAAGLIVVGAAAGIAAIGFRVAFVTDPLGPRAFPWLAAGLLVAAGVGMGARPGPDTAWPDRDARRRLAALTVSLLAWAAAMPWLGFLASTALELAFLGRLFGARIGPALGTGIAVSALLWVLFAQALGLRLPPGGGS